MKKFAPFLITCSFAAVIGNATNVSAQEATLDRTSLPIEPPQSEPITELDALVDRGGCLVYDRLF